MYDKFIKGFETIKKNCIFTISIITILAILTACCNGGDFSSMKPGDIATNRESIMVKINDELAIVATMSSEALDRVVNVKDGDINDPETRTISASSYCKYYFDTVNLYILSDNGKYTVVNLQTLEVNYYTPESFIQEYDIADELWEDL